MKINLIVGAGQLGSRHLQGLLKISHQQIVYVVDPSVESLRIARQRSKEVEHHHELFFLEDIHSIPNKIDLAIIATGSNIRDQVIKNLLDIAEVKYLLLEKVLFDNLPAYSAIEDLLERKKMKTWVNHPRRMFEHYIDIKKQLDFSNGDATFKVEGANWGLGCNGLHFLDVVSFLADSNVAYVDTSSLDQEIIASKRPNFIEFSGTIKGKLENGSYFEVASYQDNPLPISVTISLPKIHCSIIESIVKVVYTYTYDSAKNKEQQFKLEYQSELTTRLANSIFETGNCLLPTYKTAMVNHQVFIRALLDFEYKITGVKSDKLKIT